MFSGTWSLSVYHKSGIRLHFYLFHSWAVWQLVWADMGPSQNSRVKAITLDTLNVALFGDEVFKEVIK